MPDTRPNIQLLMTDQQRGDCLSLAGRSLVSLLRGESPAWRESLHIEHSGIHQTLTDGKEKFIWFPADGREQFFDLTNDPHECKNLIDDHAAQSRIDAWRQKLIEQLKDRHEGFVQGGRLVVGRPYPAMLPHVHGKDENRIP